MLTKIKIGIQGMSCQHCVKTVSDALTKLDGVKKINVNLRKNNAVISYDKSRTTIEELKKAIIESGFEASEETKSRTITFLATSLTSLILLSSIMGCSEVPYTGPILTVDDVDRYVGDTGHDTVCLQDGFDTVCIKIAEFEEDDTQEPAILEIYPESINYLFYYDNNPILEARIALDTTELIQSLIDSGRIDMLPGSTAQQSGSIAGIDEGWTIQIYYPDSFPDAERGSVPATSGLDIKVAEGTIPDIKKNQELDIIAFLQLDKDDGSRVAQFSILTASKVITIHVDGLVSDHIAIFYIDVEGVETGDGTNKLHLEPK